MRCQKCGAYIRDDSVFCNYCGERVIIHVPKKEGGLKEEAVRPRDEDFDVAPTTPKEEEERKLPQKQRPWVIGLIILAGAVFAVFAVLVYQVQKKNQRTIINPQTTPESTQASTAREESTGGTSSDTTAPAETDSGEAVVSEDTGSPEETPGQEATPSEELTESADSESSGGDSEPEDEGSDDESPEESGSESQAAEGVEIEYGGMIYLIANGEATLQKCYSSDEVIELSDTIDGAPLRAIGEAAFANCDHLIAIDVPEGVVSFGPYAFTYCRNLRAIVIPDSMTDFGEHCFDNCGRVLFIVTEGSIGYQTAVNNDIAYVLGDSIQAANDYEWE